MLNLARAQRRGRVALLVSLAAAIVASSASAALLETRGDAVSIDSGKPLYTEIHLLRHDGHAARERIVLYRCPDGRAFGRKTIDYADTPAAPTFRMEDAHVGYVEGARYDGVDVVSYFGFATDGAPSDTPIASSPSLVIDAGFDAFIRQHWAALQAGETLPMQFLVPSRGKAYTFKLAKLRDEQLQGADASVFRLSLSGMLGWFASDIDVAYRNSDQRLMRFEGLTSVRIDRSDNLAARIDFPLDAERVDVDEARWQALLGEPLSDCPPGAP